MTDLDLLKRYVNPYYQEDDDEAVLNTYLDMYTTPASAASALWYEMPQLIMSGRIKAYSTGASQTTYHSLKDIEDWCNRRAKHYASLDSSNKGISGLIVANYEKSVIAGGVSDEY